MSHEKQQRTEPSQKGKVRRSALRNERIEGGNYGTEC